MRVCYHHHAALTVIPHIGGERAVTNIRPRTNDKRKQIALLTAALLLALMLNPFGGISPVVTADETVPAPSRSGRIVQYVHDASSFPLTDAQATLSEIFQYYFPFIRYHNLWQSVGEKGGMREYYMGYLVSEHIMPYTGDPDYLKPTDEVKKISPISVYYMDKILRLCEKKGIDVILYSLCSPKCYDTTRLNAIHAYVSSRGVNYIDFNQNWKEMGIDWSHDTRDEGDHLNAYGVTKVTAYMGDYLREHYTLPDHRGEAAYASWDTLYTAYLKTLKEMEGKSYYMLEGDTVYD